MTEKEYGKLVKSMAPKSPIVKDCLFAFLIGGLICALGQAILNGYGALGLSKEDESFVRDYLGDHDTANKWMYKKLIATAMGSAAKMCVIPVQDWLGLDNSSRMNVPGTVDINWSWRLMPGLITDELAEEMLIITKRYGRANWDTLKLLEKDENS